MQNEYIPIALSTIQPNTCTGCNLYIKIRADADIRYVLYCSGNNALKEDKIKELLYKQINYLFINQSEEKLYLRYMESQLKEVIHDPSIDANVKSKMVYNVAKSIMIDIFNDPRAGDNVDRSKNWVANTVEYVLNNKDATSTMLNMVSHDYYTYTHCVDVSVLGLLFAKYLRLDGKEMNNFGTGLLLHDIGKTQINLGTLNKNGKLSEVEYAEIKKHVEFAHEILNDLGGLNEDSFYPVLQHHEKLNGKGYPKGLKGNEIHDYGKIATIIDVYDALTTKRPYSDARKPFPALQIMKELMDEHFDEVYFRSFVAFLGSRG
ncbi:MAG: HD domain-containing protein [Candidatus Kuenenia sp.]|nr:HD domain-containing protein [Candidatus Kuenenia hertensis]